MKSLLLLAILAICFSDGAKANDGYRIVIRVSDSNVVGRRVYLAHYYGKKLPTIYLSDSGRFDENNTAVIGSTQPITGGMYIVLLDDRKTYFELLLENGSKMNITAPLRHLPEGLTYEGSPENERFITYQRFLKLGEKGGPKPDAGRYRAQYAAKYPNTMLASIFNAMDTSVSFEGFNWSAALPASIYYRCHYWDKFDFRDDRLIYTPLYEEKLNEYFNRLVPANIDSIIKECSIILRKMDERKEVFKYTLWWLTRNSEISAMPGMDTVFMYLVDSFYNTGKAYWLDANGLMPFNSRIGAMRPILENAAPELRMRDYENKELPLSSTIAKYTLLIFWTPADARNRDELLKIDSIYRHSLTDKGVKIYAVYIGDNGKQWQKFINTHSLNEGWTHVWDPDQKSMFRAKYDVYNTPLIYLLDEKKTIKGKRLDNTNILTVVDMLERKRHSKKGM